MGRGRRALREPPGRWDGAARVRRPADPRTARAAHTLTAARPPLPRAAGPAPGRATGRHSQQRPRHDPRARPVLPAGRGEAGAAEGHCKRPHRA